MLGTSHHTNPVYALSPNLQGSTNQEMPHLS
jgi:hypothetical protein